MEEPDIPAILRKLMEVIPAKQCVLAQMLGTSQPQVARWLKGSQPELAVGVNILRLARAHGLLTDGVSTEDLAASLDKPPPKTVPVKGYVGAGSQAHFYALADEDFEEVEAPEGATDQTVAVEIKGTSMGPLMDTWLVFYKDVRSPITDDLINTLCVVGLADDRILIKKIVRNGRGGFSLLSNAAEPPIENAIIEWAAPVTGMRPRR